MGNCSNPASFEAARLPAFAPIKPNSERLNVEQSNVVVGASRDHQIPPPFPVTFGVGDRVRKKSGAAWQGRIVGWYSTQLTPEGYAVESEAHPGSCRFTQSRRLSAWPNSSIEATSCNKPQFSPNSERWAAPTAAT
jgi:dihydrofolate reductase (trimethoprim resistance protein)